MSSTNNNKVSEPCAGRRTGVWSITWRLTTLYVISTATLLLLAESFLYLTLQRSLEANRHALVTSKLEVLRLLLQQQPAKADVLASEVEHEAAASHPLRYYFRILDEQDRVLLETTGLKDLAPTAVFPVPSEITRSQIDRILPTAVGDRSFLLLSVRVPIGAAGREQRIVQIALDVTAGTALLTDYRHKLLAVLGVGTVFAAVAGIWVARKGMRPLAEITLQAQRITASHLHERISVSRWPRELADLAVAFDAMLNRLDDSFTRLSEFSANLAHELRTPINNLRGEAEVALARSRTPEEYQNVIASSLEEYARLSRMIDALLFLARAENRKTAFERRRFNARKEIDAVREFYDALAVEQGVEVTCRGQAWIIGDAVLFRRAISNLLANALQHTPGKGAVCISVRPLNEDTVQVDVSDTGRGIPPEDVSRVFDRFYRADRSQPATGVGTGLGLAIVQSIMRVHGGTASIQTAVNSGTTVTLRFPTDAGSGAQPSPAPGPVAGFPSGDREHPTSKNNAA